jgi:signal transduction histidine kinase
VLVLTPLDRMTRHAVAIAGGGDLSQRLNVQRDDELGTLAREFDTMVEQLAQSRREVIDHSFQAGVAELARGVLHNVGNAMTPLGVRLAKLQEALRDAPVGDVDLALGELAQAPQDPARRADLEEFLRLASAQMVRSIRSALEDSETVSRQTMLVQHALSDQLRASRGSAVLEPVEIPAVIDQSLEIVPDACRERLDIQIDDSVRRIGIVDLARTVVRLVLQNLIINAAESVRAAGLERGALRFTARIVQETGQEHLLLECADTGMGIAPENLDRIFEKGFSTKRTTSNFGIGLHWCATAVAALGGRISASSAGLGRGATLHVRLPLPSREPLPGGLAA